MTIPAGTLHPDPDAQCEIADCDRPQYWPRQDFNFVCREHHPDPENS
jgi:hypothetical protein